jgi:hypothetical protein
MPVPMILDTHHPPPRSPAPRYGAHDRRQVARHPGFRGNIYRLFREPPNGDLARSAIDADP